MNNHGGVTQVTRHLDEPPQHGHARHVCDLPNRGYHEQDAHEEVQYHSLLFFFLDLLGGVHDAYRAAIRGHEETLVRDLYQDPEAARATPITRCVHTHASAEFYGLWILQITLQIQRSRDTKTYGELLRIALKGKKKKKRIE